MKDSYKKIQKVKDFFRLKILKELVQKVGQTIEKDMLEKIKKDGKVLRLIGRKETRDNKKMIITKKGDGKKKK
jgi:predicted secreted protein